MLNLDNAFSNASLRIQIRKANYFLQYIPFAESFISDKGICVDEAIVLKRKIAFITKRID